jgi:hypothetical protein
MEGRTSAIHHAKGVTNVTWPSANFGITEEKENDVGKMSAERAGST